MHVAYQDTPKFAYLRQRPFLVIERYLVPANRRGLDRVKTERKNWMQDERNISVEEYPSVVDAIKTQHMASASLIIDILRDRVIKNRLNESDDAVLTLYKRKYSNIIEQGRNKWAYQQAIQVRDFETLRRTHKTAGARSHGDYTPEVARTVSRKV
jgi:hypothetical protein